MSVVTGRDLNQSATFSSNVSMALWDAFSSVRDHLDKAEQNSFLLCRAIDELPCSGRLIHFFHINMINYDNYLLMLFRNI